MNCCDKDNKPLTDFSLIRAGKSIIKHFTDSNYNAFAEEPIKEERIKACNACEHKEEFFGNSRCKICSCFINAKASLIDQNCPHPEGSKWPE